MSDNFISQTDWNDSLDLISCAKILCQSNSSLIFVFLVVDRHPLTTQKIKYETIEMLLRHHQSDSIDWIAFY